MAHPPHVFWDGDFITWSRRSTIEFLIKSSQHIRGKVLDVGSGKWTLPREILRETCEYVSCDCFEHPNVDIVCRVEELTRVLGPDRFDAAICTSVLEHTPDPSQVIREIHGVLRPTGLLLLTVPFHYPLHGTYRYRDYWRFTEDSLRLLLSDFTSVEIEAHGHPRSPHMYSAVARKTGTTEAMIQPNC